MKSKVISQTKVCQKRFFLLMIAPFLIGCLLFLTSLAHAEWNQQDDPLLTTSPLKQGWAQMKYNEQSPLLHQKKSVTFASR